MTWADAFFGVGVFGSFAFAAWAYCKYSYLNDKNYRDSLTKLAELDVEDK